MLERLLTGLYGGSFVALTALCAVNLALGPRFELLLSNRSNAPWYCVAGWLACAALIAALPRGLPAWRATLAATAVALLALGATGLWAHGDPRSAGAAAIAACCAALAACCAGLAIALRPSGLAIPRRASRSHPARSQFWKRLARWSCVTVATVVAFHAAHASPFFSAAAAAGSFALLVVLFICVPAATLAHWMPRVASALQLIAACLFAWLGWWGLALVSGGAALLEMTPLRAPFRTSAAA
jgi:hypothetical protein